MNHLSEDEAASLLKALGVSKVTFRLDGGGDDGDVELEDIAWKATHEDGTPVKQYDLASIPFSSSRTLLGALETAATEWPEVDWCNNEGGSGTVEIYPFDDEPVCVSVFPNGDDEDSDYDDEEDLGEDLEIEEDDLETPEAAADDVGEVSFGEAQLGPRR